MTVDYWEIIAVRAIEYFKFMIIFMSGYPGSGKSFILDLLDKNIKEELYIISPKDILPDVDGEEEKREAMLAAWETSLECLWSEIHKNKNKDIIIYDTCCSSYNAMREYFIRAKKCGHCVVYVFVNADLDKCIEKSGIDEGIFQKYKDNFSDNIPKFVELSDKQIVINNDHKGEPGISKLVETIKDGVHESAQ